jgi:hypothetical protein
MKKIDIEKLLTEYPATYGEYYTGGTYNETTGKLEGATRHVCEITIEDIYDDARLRKIWINELPENIQKAVKKQITKKIREENAKKKTGLASRICQSAVDGTYNETGETEETL